MVRVDFEEVDWDDDQLVVYNGESFTGEVVEKSPQGAVLAVTAYWKGYADGPATEWYPSGQLKARGIAKLGRAVGVHKSWHPNGQLARASVFDDTGLVSVEEWDEYGNPIPGSRYRRP